MIYQPDDKYRALIEQQAVEIPADGFLLPDKEIDACFASFRESVHIAGESDEQVRERAIYHVLCAHYLVPEKDNAANGRDVLNARRVQAMHEASKRVNSEHLPAIAKAIDEVQKEVAAVGGQIQRLAKFTFGNAELHAAEIKTASESVVCAIEKLQEETKGVATQLGATETAAQARHICERDIASERDQRQTKLGTWIAILIFLLICAVLAPKAHGQSGLDGVRLKESGVSKGQVMGGIATLDFSGATVTKTGNGWTIAITGGGGGSGTVTSFSSGDLSPLFTTSVATASTTPALSFTLSNASAHTYYGNNTGSSAAPGFHQIAYSELSGAPTLAQSLSNAAHKWLNSYDSATGLFTQTQPACTDLSDSGTLCASSAALAANTTSTAHQFFTAYNSTTGAFTKAQPSCSDLSDAGTLCTSSAALAANTTATASNFFTAYNSTTGAFTKAQPAFTDISGSVAASQMPALTGAITSSAGAVATSPGKIDVLDASRFCQDAGASDTYTCNLSPAITAYVTGTHYGFKAATANTGAATINLNSVGAITIKKASGGITTDLADNDIRAGQWVDVVYDGANMEMQSTLGNAAAGTGTVTSIATTSPITGGTITTTGTIACATCAITAGTSHGDSIYTILSSDRWVYTSANFTASRTWTLPAANAVAAGTAIFIQDLQGTVTSTNTLVISRAGSDTINAAATSVTLSAANDSATFVSDGTSKWGYNAAPTSVPNGGTGLATLTAHGVMIGAGTSVVTLLVCGANTVVAGAASADPTCRAIDLSTADVTGILAAARFPALTGDVTNSAGALATTIAASAVTRAKADSTVMGTSSVSTSSVNGTATTDVQLLQLSLPTAYLNNSNGVFLLNASGTWTTGTTQTPTNNFKLKLCTVSGCGSGTVVTLISCTSAASTASTVETWIVSAQVGTSATGASGTVVSHGVCDLPVGASANTIFSGVHDVNTAASSSIDLTAALFLQLTYQVSTQSGTKNSAIGHILNIKPAS